MNKFYIKYVSVVLLFILTSCSYQPIFSQKSYNFEIDKIKSELKNIYINSYEGPGVCKSENVYKGIESASGEIIVIYDADLTAMLDHIPDHFLSIDRAPSIFIAKFHLQQAIPEPVINF